MVSPGHGSTSGGLAPRRRAAGHRDAVRTYYGPGSYGYWSPSYYPWAPAYAVTPSTGEVKIDTHLKDASLFVGGGYVGPIDKFKKFHLRPSNHDIELRDHSGATIFNERVQVILNKTT